MTHSEAWKAHNVLTIQWNRMSEAERKSAAGKGLQVKINLSSKKLQEFEQSARIIKKAGRTVGNYKKGKA